MVPTNPTDIDHLLNDLTEVLSTAHTFLWFFAHTHGEIEAFNTLAVA
jgi:hypothetical protein